MRQPNEIIHNGKTLAEWIEYNKTEDADLSDADLRGADLRGANLRCAYLRYADLYGAENIPDYVDAVTRIIPEGDIIVYKKCENDVIVKMLVGADVQRSNATGRKCRSKSVKVLEVIGAEYGISTWNSDVVYRVGETVECDNWDENRWNECSGGIHWFITRYEAEEY